MTQILENYGPHNRSFAGHRYHIDRVIKGQSGALNPQYIQGVQHTVNTTSQSAFNGGCVTPSGLCVFSPSRALIAGIYDYVSNTFSESAAHGMTIPAFSGAALISDRYVALIPSSAAYVCFLDILTGAIERGPAHGKAALAFQGGAITEDADGREILVMAPNGSNRIGIVYLDSREYVDGPVLTAARGTQLLPNGHVAMFGIGSTALNIYDPVTKTIYQPYGQTPLSDGAVLLPDGRMTIDASSKFAFSTITPIFGRATGWPFLTSQSILPAGTNKHNGIRLAPNGDLIAIPAEKTTVTIYTPPTLINNGGVITTGPALPTAPALDKFSGGLMVPNGDIIMIPDRNQYVGIYRHMDNAKGFPVEVCASRFYGSAF